MIVSDPPRVASFRHRVAAHASSGALRDLLEHHRLAYGPEPLSEGAVFGLSGALDLRVRIAAAAGVLALDGRAPSLEPDLCRHLGLPAELVTTDDAEAGWAALRAELDAGRPTLVHADRAELDYLGDDRHDTRHAIVVLGYDAAAGVAWVADQHFPEPQRCALDALACARASRAWPGGARHALLRLRAPEALADPREAVGRALERTVRRMRDARGPEGPHVRTGLDAVDALAQLWPELPARAGARLAGTLCAVRLRVRDGGTGGALYRSLQARFEHDAAALLGSPELGHAALVCDDLADAWRALAGAIRGEDAAVAHRAAGAWVERVRALEHRHVEALEAHLGARAGARA
jgi:hypothetical protein